MSTLEALLGFWPAIAVAGTVLGSVVVFWSNVLKIRELQLKLGELKKEAMKPTSLHLPTTEEVATYAALPTNEVARKHLDALKRARLQTVLVALIALSAIASVLYFGPHGREDGLGPRVRFEILAPTQGSLVGEHVLVKGRGLPPDRGAHIYVLVRPANTDAYWVQSEPAVQPDGRWEGRVSLGSGATGEGQRFHIRAIATRQTLPEGRIATLPEDAVTSNEIVVHR